MQTPKLLLKEGIPVREWTLSREELEKFHAMSPPPRGEIRPIPIDFDRKKLRDFPLRFERAELEVPEIWWQNQFSPALALRKRKNQKNLTIQEWKRFICTLEILADTAMPSPNYYDFVDLHHQAMSTSTGMSWGAHNAIRFLAWHREYLAKFEARLMSINPLVTLPYWNWVVDRTIPFPLNNLAVLSAWNITRNSVFNGNSIASAAQLNTLLGQGSFSSFQTALEAGPFHNLVHGLVGGTMSGSKSPADPLFWLHHAFIDKLWADWQTLHPGVNPPNSQLQPPPIMTRTVNQVLSIQSLGYVYV